MSTVDDDEYDFRALKYYILLLIIPMLALIVLTFVTLIMMSQTANNCIKNGMEWQNDTCVSIKK